VSTNKVERLSRAGAFLSEHRLKNGLRILVGERHLDPVVAVTLWYGVGARNEREEEAGLSHFLEHMMFKGSERFAKGEVDLVTTVLGGSNNAHTGYDHTAYWFELASDRWQKALEIEADRMRGLTLDPREFEAEKAVVLEELSMGKDDPWSALTQEMSHALFPRHPYRRPIIGYADGLTRADPELMRQFHERFYHPGNAMLVVVGDVRPNAVVKAAREHFGDLPAGPVPAEADRWRPTPAEPRGERRLSIRWDDPGHRLALSWPTAPVGTPEDDALDIACMILASGRLSRLYRRLVIEEGLASYVGASNDTRIEAGVFWLYAELNQGIEPAVLEAAVERELARMRDTRPSAAEMKRARSLLASSEAFEGETATDLAESIGSFAIDKDWRLAVDGVERRKKVSAKQVQEACARFLTPGRRVLGWCLPTGSPEVVPLASSGAEA